MRGNREELPAARDRRAANGRGGAEKGGGQWHLITGEYPPQHGGVADYSRLVAAGLAAEGDVVHVWCPAADGPVEQVEGVVVHRDLGDISAAALRRVGRQLDRFSGPRRLLVQWVPHGYGYRAMNFAFCAWLLARSRLAGDEVYLMVHEAYVAFEGSWKQHAVAVAHRLMSVLLLQAARQVWVGTPAWGDRLRPYRLQRRPGFRWLPVPSNIPRVEDAAAARRLRERYAGEGQRLVGHFGTYGRLIAPLLDQFLPALLDGRPEIRMLLLGRGAAAYRSEFVLRHPDLAAQVVAPEGLDDHDLSLHLSACDLFAQPYPEGVNCRRGSAMAVVGHGRPLATQSGPFTEPVWREYGAAVLAPLGSAPALARECHRLLHDPQALARLAEGAERVYRERFDVSHTVAAFRAAGGAETEGPSTAVEVLQP